MSAAKNAESRNYNQFIGKQLELKLKELFTFNIHCKVYLIFRLTVKGIDGPPEHGLNGPCV